MKVGVIALFLYLALFAKCDQYILVFKDDFNNQDSLNNWNISIMPGSDSGNNELEYYTDRPQNVNVNNGNLVITAIHENYQDYQYTSGKIISKQSFGPYGFFNFRAKIPKGKGLWPALWMLPPNAQSQYGGWAACGEIDVFESINEGPEYYGTCHFGGQWPNNVQGPSDNIVLKNLDFDNYHMFSVEWQPDHITWYYDAEIVNGQISGGIKGSTLTSAQWYSINPQTWQKWPGNAPFNVPFNMIINLAIGGNWPCSAGGCPPNPAVFPATLLVDWVEVWEKTFNESTK